MFTDLTILIICCITITGVGLLIFLRNPSKTLNQRFALLSVSLVLWTVSNYFSDHSTQHVLLSTRLVFLGGVATAWSLIKFISSFPTELVFKRSRLLRIHALVSYLLMPLVFTPAFISSVVIEKSGSGNIHTSYLYNFFLVYIFFTLLLMLIIIRRQLLNAKTAAQKQQVMFISWGIVLYAFLAIFSNVVLPLLINNWSSSRWGPAFTLIFVGLVSYSIVKHRLFDIRLIVARSAAYVLSIGFITGIFSLLIFGFSGLSIENYTSKTVQRFTYVLVTLVLVTTYPYLKRSFDRLTNKLFYRDAYDSQQFFNELNKVLVSSIDLELILKKSAEVIERNLKTLWVRFEIYDIDDRSIRHIPHLAPSTAKDQFIVANSSIFDPKSDQELIVTDEIVDDDDGTKQLLSEHEIAAIARLSGSTQKNGSIAYMTLGRKKSGNIYNKQDIRVLEILSDELMIAIQNALRFEEIQQFNITLQQKVDEATKQLRKTNEKLKELDETKDEFISMASHQLRTPLTSMKGYVSMVLEGDTGRISTKQRQMLDQAFASAQRMVYLIADLLNVSRLRTGKFVIENKPTQLIDVVGSEMDQLVGAAKAKNLELTFDKPKSLPTLSLDETKIRQVVMNFIDNALYYTPAGGHIHVGLADKDDSVEFTVVDDGLGVPKAEQHHLFTKFYRAGNARQARPDGTGLGLFMAKKVIVAQGGAIIFSSIEGKGSTFGFTLPKAKLAVSASEAK